MAFWQSYIDAARFDHPEQPTPRRGGVGWAKIPMPEPMNWLTAYRTGKGDGGLFTRLRGGNGQALYEALGDTLTTISDEIGAPLEMRVDKEEPFEGTVFIQFDGDVSDNDGNRLG